MARSTRNGKCNFNFGWGIVAAILATIGIFLAVQGFVVQLASQGSWDTTVMGWVLGYYFVGILLLGGAKLLKWKAHEDCKVHGK